MVVQPAGGASGRDLKREGPEDIAGDKKVFGLAGLHPNLSAKGAIHRIGIPPFEESHNLPAYLIGLHGLTQNRAARRIYLGAQQGK